MPLRQQTPLLGSVLALGFAVVLTVSISSIWMVRESTEVSDRISDAQSVSTLYATLRAELRRAESGQRGYLLVGSELYLRDYEEARGRVPGVLQGLAPFAAEVPERQARLDTIRPLVESRLEEMAKVVSDARAGQREAALAIVATGRGLNLMGEFLNQVQAASDGERRILDQELAWSGKLSVALFAVSIVGAMIIAALAGLAIYIVRRGSRELLAANAAVAEANRSLEEANRSLEARVSERTADLQEANEEIQRYAYVVSHDLRAPLVNIMGFTSELEALRADLLKGEADGSTLAKDFDEALSYIKSSISKMDRLINAILQLSRVGRREFKAQRIDLDEMFTALEKDFSHRAQELGAAIAIGPLPKIVSDRLAIEQIVSNLVDNALKYLRHGVPGRIEVAAVDHGSRFRLSVSDNGRGIAGKDRERIFELFRRAGAQDRPGEGIGLAHVRMLVRRLGGSIKVESEVNRGSTFILDLPKVWMP